MKIIRLLTSESTNTECFNYLKDHNPVIVIAQNQTRGKGRGDNTWESPKGNIYMSYGTIVTPRELENLSMNIAAGLFESVHSVLIDKAKDHLKLKWPNDLYLDNRKLAGILVESKILQNEARIAIGVGLNYHCAPLPTAVSMDNFTTHSKEDIEYKIADTISQKIKFADFNKTKAIFQQKSFFKSGDCILFNSGNKTVNGEFKGYSDNLSIVININGVDKNFVSGEVQSLKATP